MADGFGTQDILTGRGLGLAGFGGWGFGGPAMPGMLGADLGFSYAAPAANAARIDAVGAEVASQNDFTRELAQSDIEGIRNSFDQLVAANEATTTRDQMNSGFANIANANLQNVIVGGQAALANERRQSDLYANLNGQISDSRAEGAKCCCETQKLILTTANDTQSLINQRYTDLITDQKNTLQQTLNTERIIAAIGSLRPVTNL